MSAITPSVAPSGRRYGAGMLVAALLAGALASTVITWGARLTGTSEASTVAVSGAITPALTAVREASAPVAVSGAITPALTAVREAPGAVAVLSGAITPALTPVREAPGAVAVSGAITQALTPAREAPRS